jgi:hypothetical protein
VIAFAIVLAIAGNVSAAETSRVAVVGPREAAVTRQLDAELQLLGFEVVHADPPEAIEPEALRALAKELDVAAAILVDRRPDRLDLWVVDRVTGKTSIRVIAVDDPASTDAARIGAVRAIDLLRASFRELEDDPRPPAAEVEPSQPVLDAVASQPRPRRGEAARFGLSFGPAIAGGPGGVGPTAHVALGFQFMPHRIFGLAVRGFAPIAGTRVRAPEGSARLDIGWITAGPSFSFLPPTSVLRVDLVPSAGIVFVGMRGDASPPFVARRDLVVAAMIDLQLGLAVRVHPRLRLRLDGSIAAVLPRAGIRIAGRRAATWGLPVGVGVLSVQVLL